MRDFVTLRLNGKTLNIRGVSPTRTLLEYLRETERLKGTKEGCAEGDCGACSIVLVRINEYGKTVYDVVNSCLLILPQLDGANVVTVEGLDQDGLIDPVQSAIVQSDGSQCGFCTPGMLMAAADLLVSNPKATRQEIREYLSGNYCRCTGYQAIVDAVETVGQIRNGGST